MSQKAQDQDRHGRVETPLVGPPSIGRPRLYKLPTKKERRSFSSSISSGGDNSGSASGSDSDNDSGYISTSDLDARAEYYRQR